MSKGPQDKLLDHEYDGIREYDNPLPGWWLILFYINIVITVVYVPYYHFGPGPLALERLDEEGVEAARALEAYRKTLPPRKEFTVEELAALEGDAERIKAGAKTFTKLCVSCHLKGGAGQTGPNLTDDYWLHGGKLPNILNTVTNGVEGTSMIAWKTQLNIEDLASVSVYVRSLRGSNPPGGLPPQGQLEKD
ncbi:c-type cytochrome [Myxococcota bacterium]|nr:c-type cytochrome [Myxococcota bacterium]MBU1898935.1 c-type cytochrome [Myxococcota bacterium]